MSTGPYRWEGRQQRYKSGDLPFSWWQCFRVLKHGQVWHFWVGITPFLPGDFCRSMPFSGLFWLRLHCEVQQRAFNPYSLPLKACQTSNQATRELVAFYHPLFVQARDPAFLRHSC
jgi:hypothetical protein